jgi:predicted amidohydrolase YtcJ
MATHFFGGTIWCSLGVTAQSIRIDGPRIVSINSDPEPGDEIVNLGDHFLAPAFMDGHAHPLFAGRQAQGPLVN